MTPARRKPTQTYKPPRDRRELIIAILSVLGVVAFTVVMIVVLAPEDETPTPTPPFTLPTTLPTDPTATTLPGATTVVPPTTVPVG